MEQFKLRDIEEFDSDFKTLIDKKLSEDSPEAIHNTAAEADESPEIFSEEENTPLIEKEKQELFENVISDEAEYEKEHTEAPAEDDEPMVVKKSNGLVICKVLSIVLLCSTVVVFILGCFVSVFLDNNGLDVGGFCFNTQCQTINTLGVKQGDLIISRKSDISKFNLNDVVCVPQSDGNGCDVQVVKNTFQNGPDEIINTIAFENDFTVESAIQNELCYGHVKCYIPSIGRIINFAMQNAILVCGLFILIAALWCIILILVEKKISDPKATNE